MSRRIVALTLLLLPTLASGAIWPDTFANQPRTSISQPALAGRQLWEEYGLKDSETAGYGAFQATAYRFQDSTGAMAAFEWQRPADAKSSGVAKLAVETRDGLLLAHGNYLFRFQGYKPQPSDLAGLFQTLPKLEQSPLPPLIDFLPAGKLVANSERYITGPASLAAFDAPVPPSTAAFHLGAEAQMGTYQDGSRLAIFVFPTPQIAMERIAEFEKIPGAMAKRTGPLVAIIVAPPNRDEAERLLSQVRYQAEITWSEHVPTAKDNPLAMVWNAMKLAGILLLFCLTASLAFGSFRAVLRWRRGGLEPESVITLHLLDRQP